MKEKKLNKSNKSKENDQVDNKINLEVIEANEEDIIDIVVEDNIEKKLENEVETNTELESDKHSSTEKEEYEFYRPTISSSTYGETVDNLVKEVQLFHEEGEIELNKKSKLRIIVLLILLIIIGITVAVIIINNKDKDKDNTKEKSKEEVTYNYEYKELDNKIEFYDDGKIIDTYTCMSDNCSAYSYGRYSYFSVKPTIIAISDDNSIFLYNYTEKRIISAFYTSLQNLVKDDKTAAFIAYNAEGLAGIIDINGNVIVPFEYDAIGYSIGGGDVTDYSYETNLITVSQDGLWGLLSLRDGNISLDIKYEDIYYNGFSNVVVKEKGLWYLLDLDGEKILENSYDIIIPTKSYIFVSVNDAFKILNYKGNNIISKEISTYIKAFRKRDKTITPTFKIEVEGTIINIHIMKDDINYVEYKFNTVNGELTEVIK